MKKNIVYIICLFISIQAFSQVDLPAHFTNYINGYWTNCEKPSNDRSIKLYDLGLECIRKNKYLGTASKIFQDLIKTDSTFCDAYFLAGYTFRLSNMNREAITMYYMADSLSQEKSLIYKQNLATISMVEGITELARKKFEEIVTHFPESPEGYYGIALTATEVGDFDNGLKNIDIAIKKYKNNTADAVFLKAILLTLKGKHEESLQHYREVKGHFKKDDYFNGNYALSLYEVSVLTNDQKMKKEAKKYYQKIKNKEELTEYIRNKLEN